LPFFVANSWLYTYEPWPQTSSRLGRSCSLGVALRILGRLATRTDLCQARDRQSPGTDKDFACTGSGTAATLWVDLRCRARSTSRKQLQTLRAEWAACESSRRSLLATRTPQIAFPRENDSTAWSISSITKLRSLVCVLVNQSAAERSCEARARVISA
jgi:hypothetical protein